MKKSPLKIPQISQGSTRDRMFRTKPYTKCITCLTDSRIKCKKCIESIVNQITKQKNPKQTSISTATSFKPKQFCYKLEKEGSSKSQVKGRVYEKQYLVTNKYQMWMEKVRLRKQRQCASRKWPRKQRIHDKNLQKYGIKQAKFQKWQRKIVDKLFSKLRRF